MSADERAGDVEALARLLRPLVDGSLGQNYSAEEIAQGVLDSRWLAARDARLIAEAERRGAERALLEAADAPWEPSHAAGHQWLRARAAQIGEVRP